MTPRLMKLKVTLQYVHHAPFLLTPAPIVVLDARSHGPDVAVHKTSVYRPNSFDRGCALVLVG